MTLQEVATLFGRHRRTIMRMVRDGRLPKPEGTEPLSWDARAIRAARKRMQNEARNGRGHDQHHA